jgi:hypothetical protein
MLLEGYEWFECNPFVDIEYQHNTLNWIVMLYEEWNKPDKASEWRLKLPVHMQ